MDSVYSLKYLSEELLVHHFGDSADRIGESLYNSKISLNPHQIQAALFAFSSPVSKGVMLCDEVGLGKTIEAGIVISQYWCEHKRNILIITPASLTRQWASELEEKFNIPSSIVDKKYYTSQIRSGVINPFEGKNKVLIMSINFASKMHSEIKASKIDLVVIDEAHKLRNVYNPSNVMANNIFNAINGFKKILLTATPLQNNLMELYGLSQIIDNNIFGDKEYYKKHYIHEYEINKEELKIRLSDYIHRTLRNQVQKYVKYSKRITHTFEFTPTKEEDELYDMITELIQSNPSFGTKKGQAWLIGLVLRKLLSSSTPAVVNTLNGIKARLEKIIKGENVEEIPEFLSDEDLEEEASDDEYADFEVIEDIEKTKRELALVNKCLLLADKIDDDKKAFRLLEAIEFLFNNVTEGREKKILIFTESRRTQDYLYNFLKNHGYNNTVLFNGGNSDEKTSSIYQKWITKPENFDKAKNNKSTNIRSAILEYFKDTADIMIATEAGAEGLNIQFCSMMVNYDLPWNPQRVEQRIGRCHRFGQKNDVIVINFLNKHNQIDARIYELLQNKFKLFDDVFGSSDEVLGKLDSETNFEHEIYNIYSTCRTPKEINDAFDKLQEKYSLDISKEMKKTRELLIDNFDEDLQNIFDSILEDAKLQIKGIESNFWRICCEIFSRYKTGLIGDYTIDLKRSFMGIPEGNYVLASNDRTKVNLHFDDNNGKRILDIVGAMKLPTGAIFNITNYKYKIRELEQLIGKTGILVFGKVCIESFEKEEYLLVTARLNDGTFIDADVCQKLFRIPSEDTNKVILIDKKIIDLANADFEAQSQATANKSIERSNITLNEEITKVDNWVNDKISGIELEVELLREQRKNLQKQADFTNNAVEKIELEAEIDKISKTIRKKWLELADSEERVEKKRKELISKLKAQCTSKITNDVIFAMPFEVK